MEIKFEVKLLTFKYFLQKNQGLFFCEKCKVGIYSLAKFYLPPGLYFSRKVKKPIRLLKSYRFNNPK
ncbi:MAG: hypothetical protein EAY66_03745 [Sphingobacteriales bacterium]|nr:MAG: hypothetical protein EAY66_03745 [Sphingobacteriales bacterium]